MFKVSTIHTNTMHSNDYRLCQCAIAAAMMEWSSSLHSTSSTHVLSSHSHPGSANGRPSLQGYRRRCSRRIRWSHLWGMNSGVSLWMQQRDSVTSHSRARCYFIDVSITSPGKGCSRHVNVVSNLPYNQYSFAKSYTKNHEDPSAFVKVIVKEMSGTLFYLDTVQWEPGARARWFLLQVDYCTYFCLVLM